MAKWSLWTDSERIYRLRISMEFKRGLIHRFADECIDVSNSFGLDGIAIYGEACRKDLYLQAISALNRVITFTSSDEVRKCHQKLKAEFMEIWLNM